MNIKHDDATRARPLDMIRAGRSVRSVSREVGATWNTIKRWVRNADGTAQAPARAPRTEKQHVEVVTESGLCIEGDPRSVAALLRALD